MDDRALALTAVIYICSRRGVRELSDLPPLIPILAFFTTSVISVDGVPESCDGRRGRQL